jgi:anti-sigma factor RsiW
MWKNRSDEHCSDDVLLAHLDGELYGLARLRTARHLRKCWECRAHLSELEHQAESLARVTERELVRQSGSTAEARSKFLAWREEFEQNTPPAPPQRTNSWRWSLAAVATCAALVLVFLPRPRQPGTAVPPASEVLQGVQSFQAGLRQ